MVYIYSTMSAGVIYPVYLPSFNDLPRIEKEIFIQGKANVPNDKFVTPRGVLTVVTETEYEALKLMPLFQFHCDKGFLAIEMGKEQPIEKIVKTMAPKDKSAPKNPKNYVKQTDEFGNTTTVDTER